MWVHVLLVVYFFFLHFVLSTVVGNRNVFPLPFLSVSHCNMSISFLPFFYSAPHKSFHCWFSFLTIQIRTIFLSHFPSFFPTRHTSNSSIQFLCAYNGIYQDFILFIRCRFLFFCNSSMLFPVMFVLQFSFFFLLCYFVHLLSILYIFFLLLETFLCLHRSVHFLFTFSVIWPRPMSIIKPLVRIIALWFNLLTIGRSVGSQSNCYKRTSMNRHHASTHTHERSRAQHAKCFHTRW